MTDDATNIDELRKAWKLLTSSPDFKVLMRMPEEFKAVQPKDDSDIVIASYIDCETTGFDADKDEIIEVGLINYKCTTSGQVLEITDRYQAFNEPLKADISPTITKITGITPEMVKGHKIDKQRVNDMLAETQVVVAHNAAFDRKFCEKMDPIFENLAWACSMNDIPWKDLGMGGQGLEFLAMKQGFFYGAHRADTDCRAGIELLSRPLPDGQSPLKIMLDNARKPTYRIWATNSPFDLKDMLKKREYKWNDGEDGRPKAWYKDTTEEDYLAECEFLKKEIYQRDLEIHATRINAFNRYSSRC